MEKIKRIDRSLVYKGAWISMYTDSMAFANGNFADWDFIHHNGAAAMVAEEADGRIVMIRQWRPGAEREILELPAGGINQGEEPIDAAVRELREETGALCENAIPLLMIQPSPAYNDEKVHMFYCKVTGYSELELDENEYVTIERYSLEELIEMILSGKIADSKTVAGLFAYQELKKRNEI
ncbi:MAG: NUDIX hydrolase [Lachnospiraceae bacterium]|nr:NUDIX hydrolase [Lachnospiraceae bacterium]